MRDGKNMWLAAMVAVLVWAPVRLGSQPSAAGGRPVDQPVRRSTPRVPPVAESARTDLHRTLAANYAPEGRSGHDLDTLLNHPELVKGVMPFVKYVSGDSTLAPRDRELVILRTAWLCRSEYLWAHHLAIAEKLGGGGDLGTRIARGPDARGWDAFDATLLRLADELHQNAFVNDATWNALAARYDRHHMMDAVFTVAEFTMLSGTLNSLGVQLEPGVTARLPADVPHRVSALPREPPLKTARIAALERSAWTPEVRALLDPTNSGRNVVAAYRTFAQHPQLYPPRQLLSEYIRQSSTLTAHVRELLILRVGWLGRSEYEWAQHAPGGRAAGLDTERIAVGSGASGWDPLDAALLRFVDELYRDDMISDATWNTLAERMDTKSLMDALITTGGYRMVSMALNTFGVQLEPGNERFPSTAAAR